jgi:enterochelin esterase-like enzyme
MSVTAQQSLRTLFVWAILAGILGACDALAPYNPTPVAIVITNIPTITPSPTVTPSPTATLTPVPTFTPFVTPSATPFPCTASAGEVIEFRTNPSAIVNENLRYLVYLPPCYIETGRRFPTVYLIHGASYREQQWGDIGLIRALDEGILNGTLAPMLVVMPYFGVIGQENAFPPAPSYERVILEELMPSVELYFCTLNNRASRAIGGISRGGFWAYSIAMRHPDLFGKVGGHSAYFPNDTRLIPAPFNPLELALNDDALRQAVQARDVRLYLDNGANDSSSGSLQLFSSRLTARGIPHTYVVHPIGEHNNDYWSAHVGEYAAFYAEGWEKDYNRLPSCAEQSP